MGQSPDTSLTAPRAEEQENPWSKVTCKKDNVTEDEERRYDESREAFD